jgi:NADH-quinone oxidoreductase subunit H
MVLAGVAVIGLFAGLGLVLVLMERRVAAWIQIRLGPNRVGPFGLLQSMADTLKLIVKEGLTPDGADKVMFNVAPFIAMIVAMLLMAPIAFAKDFQLWDLNIGVLYVTAVSSIMVISILMAGWSSNNKYSLMGAMRSGAQIVSYELSAGLSIMTIIVLTGSLQVSDIIQSQSNGWWIFKGHLPVWISFVIFIIAVTAETNRAPFDLAEAESELTAGFHTEYSGMKFGMFFMADLIETVLVSALMATLFLGGWQVAYLSPDGFHFPWGTFVAVPHIWVAILGMIAFFLKLSFFIWLLMTVRWTLPRFRYDQLMRLGWQILLPASLVNIAVTAIVITLLR